MAEEHILVIDDELVMCKLLTDLLSDRGFKVDYTLSGQEGIERAKGENFDLVITDLKMPDIDGLRVLEEIRGFDPQSVVIVITGYPSFETVQEALRHGAYDYLTKPFNIDEISFVIRRAVSFRKLSLTNIKLLEELKKENLKLDEMVKKRTGQLRLIYQIVRDVSSSLNLDTVLKTIVRRIAQVLDAEICSLLLFDKETGELSIKAAQGLNEDIIAHAQIKVGEKISGWVFQHKEAVLVSDIETDPRFARRNKEKHYNHSFISVPMFVKDEVVGVLNVSNKRSRQSFTNDDFYLIQRVTQGASIAIENARLYSSLEETYLRAVKALTMAIDAKDNYTRVHSENVTKYAVVIAREMRLPEGEIEKVRQACQLHDLGKIGIHDYILTKPGKLTEEEWEEMKLHSLKSVEILQPLTFLDGVVTLVGQHHEHYDGTGYPYALKGENIKLGARIIGVADAFDAMLSKRPYRKKIFTKQEAVEEIKKNSGLQFDPQVVEAFLRIVDSL